MRNGHKTAISDKADLSDASLCFSSKNQIMITKLNHVSIFVLNQDNAFQFYVNKLGFKVHTNVPVGPGMRWLTVCPPEQPDLEIYFMSIEKGMTFTKESAAVMGDLVKEGTFGFEVFECNDLQATYEELSQKGIEFKKPPTQEFYGLEAILRDHPGN